MKKFVLFSVLGLLLMNCTNDDSVGENVETTSPESSFLSISIVSGNSTGTRADYQQGGGDYRDGTEEESYVKNVLFLFYDADGKPAKAVKKEGTYYTYSLWENVDNGTTSDKGHGETVEHILNTTISITVPRKDNKPVLPAQLIAIVNPPSDYSELVEKNLSDLPDVVEDYETDYLKREMKTGRFIMTNSVYVDNEKIINSTALKESDYYSDKGVASHPVVVVYVERVLARIDLEIDIKNSDPKEIKTGEGTPYYIYFTGVNSSTAETDRDVYVRFLGWNVYNTPDKSYLVKNIDNEWTDEEIFGKLESGVTEPWNASIYHRSFWAINPEESRFTYKNGPFKQPENAGFYDEWTANQYKIASPGKYTTAYFQENAAPYDDFTAGPTNPSSVIIAAQLVNSDGTPRELAKWADHYYTWNDLLKQFCNNMNYWYRTSASNDNTNTIYTYTHISPDDLTYEGVTNSSNVNIALNDDAKGKEWYTLKEGVDKDAATTDDFEKVEKFDDINTYIKDTYGNGTVKYWKEGYTYFKAPIRHLGLVDTAPGYYGVVRNHIYEVTITSVTGLGTPVVNIDDPIIIYPQDEEEANLSAEVRILSWRVVKQNYDLNW